MSNSNFNITKVVVDPVSQEITNLEINGKAVETGGEANLQVGYLEDIHPGDSGIFEPDEEYDGFSYVEYDVEQANLENIEYSRKTPLNVSNLFGENPSHVQVIPNPDFDGIAKVDIFPGGLTGYPALPQTLQSTSTIFCDENGNVAPDTETVDAIVSYDTESLLPLITNIWRGSSSYSKLNILDHKLVVGGDYYVYKVSESGDYPYIKEVE